MTQPPKLLGAFIGVFFLCFASYEILKKSQQAYASQKVLLSGPSGRHYSPVGDDAIPLVKVGGISREGQCEDGAASPRTGIVAENAPSYGSPPPTLDRLLSAHDLDDKEETHNVSMGAGTPSKIPTLKIVANSGNERMSPGGWREEVSIRCKYLKSIYCNTFGWIGVGIGVLSGLLAGIYGMGGPPIIFYYNLIAVSKEQMRATNSSYSILRLPVSIIGGYLAGVWRRDMLVPYLLVPFTAIIGTKVGSCLHDKVDKEVVMKILFYLVLLSSVSFLGVHPTSGLDWFLIVSSYIIIVIVIACDVYVNKEAIVTMSGWKKVGMMQQG
jgi:hypothetical protein